MEESHAFQATFISESALEHGFSAYLRREHDINPRSVTQPEDVPATERDRVVNLARKVLLAGGNRTGFSHHTAVARSLRECSATGVDDNVVRSLLPNELRFGRLQGDKETQMEKAETVLAWARAEISLSVLEDIEREQVARITSAWDDAAEAAQEQAAAREFRESLPTTLNGWERFDAVHDCIEAAYRAENHGVPVVVAIYRDVEGQHQVKEWTVEAWIANDRNPRETPANRHLSTGQSSDGAYETLRSHLRMYDSEPIPDGESFNIPHAA